MQERFSKNQNLYLDLGCFDPKRFKDINISSLALKKIAQLVPDCDEGKLKEELLTFSDIWPRISNRSYENEYKIEEIEDFSEDFGEDSEEEDAAKRRISSDECDFGEEEMSGGLATTYKRNKETVDEEQTPTIKQCSSNKTCKSCIKCAFAVIREYSMYSRQYSELYKVYKYILTLPMTQVSCERSFSKLKIIKSRLRSRLADDHLEALFLMNAERDLLVTIDNNLIIDNVCKKKAQI